MARRGITTQQSNRQTRVQPYPYLSPNLKSFQAVLTPKYLSSQGNSIQVVVD